MRSHSRFVISSFVVVVASVLLAKSHTPAIRINSATILYTYNTSYFKKELCKQWVISGIKQCTVALVMALLLNGFLLDRIWIADGFALLVFFLSMMALSWIVYHENSKKCLIAKSVAATSQNNYARMSQLAEENRPQSVRGIMYGQLHPTKSNALFIKGVIELLRMQSQVLIVIMVFILMGGLIACTDLFAAMPLPDLPEVRKMVGALCITMALNSFYQMLIKQEKVLLDKRCLGLPLPYSIGKVWFSYALIVFFVNAGLSLLFGLILNQKPWNIILFMIGVDCGYMISALSTIFHWKPQNIFMTISTMLIMVGTIIMLIL